MHQSGVRQRRDSLSRPWRGKSICLSFWHLALSFISQCKECIIVLPVYCAKLGQMFPSTTMECERAFPGSSNKSIKYPPYCSSLVNLATPPRQT